MNKADNKFCKSRETLLENLISKGIKNHRVLEAISSVKREDFVPDNLKSLAYEDRALGILDGQTISQPYTVAFMLELLELEKGMKVLEIGTGSAYLTILLEKLGGLVYTMERSEILFNNSKKILSSYPNVKTKFGDGSLGWFDCSPYHRVIISAASPIFPNYLSSQLFDDAIVICPVGDLLSQIMYKGIYSNNEFKISTHNSFKFVPLIGKNAWDA